MRIAIGISYQGSLYHGWQTQAGLRTVQSVVEEAISKVADHPIILTCAGRTDKGVHALGQVAHFDSTALRHEQAWLLGSNHYLPRDIRIHWVHLVDKTFHARFSASARTYRYIIYNHPVASALWNPLTTHCYYPLDEARMQKAAYNLIGEHDFSSFRAIGCQSKTAMRTVYSIDIQRKQRYVILEITANAFLHHMVRTIAGVLMVIGAGKQEPSWAKEVLQAKDRSRAAVTAKPNGLYLMEVTYPKIFSLPQQGILEDPLFSIDPVRNKAF